MSGCGRRSQYRKGVTNQYLDADDIELTEKDQVVQITGNRGANAFSILLANGEAAIAKLPNKFHKVLWVKSRDFVVVETLGDEVNATDTLMIKYVLSKDNIKSLKRNNQWPEVFDAPVKGATSNGVSNDYAGDMPPMDDGEEEYEEEEEPIDPSLVPPPR
jgi:translation initiation factor IF-1